MRQRYVEVCQHTVMERSMFIYVLCKQAYGVYRATRFCICRCRVRHVELRLCADTPPSPGVKGVV